MENLLLEVQKILDKGYTLVISKKGVAIFKPDGHYWISYNSGDVGEALSNACAEFTLAAEKGEV